MATTIAWKPLYFLLPFLLPFLAYSSGRPIIESAGWRSGCGVGTESSSECHYTLRVKTGTRDSAGTDSTIGISLAGADRVQYSIANLVRWGGMMENGHDYFENGNIDIFSGCGTCVTSPPCWMKLTSDGTGSKAGWFVDYVELMAAGPNFGCTTHRFVVNRWLALDEPPYNLYVVGDNCGKSNGNGNGNGMGRDEEN